jgi:DNA polymerase
MNLDSLKEQASKCQLCDLSKSRDSVLFGEGNPNADIIFVGDTPTIAEESSGGLFIGNSGEILTNMIERVLLLPRGNVYITNILKCHISNHQPPTPTQIHTCLPYIKREIEIIKPSLVVALGSSVYEYLTGESRDLGEIRGVIKRQDGYNIVATYHPSYLLRNPSAKREAFEDMKFIRGLIKDF